MEGKEYRDEEEENKYSDSSDNNDSLDDQGASDDFGLPEVEDADSSFSGDTTEDTFEDSYESGSDDYSYSSDSDYNSGEDQPDYYASDQDQDYDEYNQDEPAEATNDQKDYYIHGLDDEDKGGGSAGWIIGIIIFIILLAVGYWWFFMRETPEPPKPKPKPKPKVEVVDTIPKVEEPIIKDEPVSNTIPGQVIQLSSPTGRYYVIVASFVDDDLALDYGNKLATTGVGSTILSPKTEKGFYRLALADFESLNEATLEAERLKSTYGSDVWVIRY